MLGPDFERILESAKAGDHAAVERIYLDLAPVVRGYAAANGVDDADDLTGDVFVSVLLRLGYFEGPEDRFRSWVLTITHRRVVDTFRNRQRQPVSPTTTGMLPELDIRDVEDEALSRLRAHGVLDAMERLTDDQRWVLTLRVVADLPVRDVSEITGKPISAVKALQRRALQSLRRAAETEPRLR